jgi:hypothetical protein
MPLLDTIQQHVTSEVVTTVDKAITVLENALKELVRNLSPEERQR